MQSDPSKLKAFHAFLDSPKTEQSKKLSKWSGESALKRAHFIRQVSKLGTDQQKKSFADALRITPSFTINMRPSKRVEKAVNDIIDTKHAIEAVDAALGPVPKSTIERWRQSSKIRNEVASQGIG
ncbi:MAG: hypothetical protein MK137_04140 [Rickettsiales bacterium]|nr:hypothetical protein [Rickettsiales bacterium]